MFGARQAGVSSLVMSVLAATALTGAAFFTVSRVDCDRAPRYEERHGVTELVDSCLTAEDLPAPPRFRDRAGWTDRDEPKAPSDLHR
ncbi:hypothetical protein FHR81_002818 [Actinoalloteichus hoggarensis]|uniref:Uncharacterized protein n=1 Tax=Actinoalloteichus hoggarensis TaxID=1470176 RepID=A0A221VY36_9PSEU|nr:hypothetical protein [Actinoalloteichus hoggarensis]ASO18413.1 hypothetical protein AHOG_03785 [Actinoalloteichus hoggarensis]MBB5921778.1 hypothetical protein [Actinoalloteichus hoggarensis]